MPRKQKTKDFFINSGSSCYTEPFISLLCGVALGEDTTAAGWLRFMYNGMEVMVNTNEAASGGGWNFTGAKIVKHNAPVSIVDTEIFNTNQDLEDAVMFD